MAAVCRACWIATSNNLGYIAQYKRVEASGFGLFVYPSRQAKNVPCWLQPA